MKAKIFKIQTFKLITFLPLHRISLQYFATCSAGYISSGVLVHVHLYIPAPPQQSFIQGSSAPRSNHWSSYPFIYHFWQKRYPFRIHVPKSVDKCHTFHLLSLELCIPLNCCECTVFKKWINQKTTKFFRFSHSHKMHLLALSSLFTHRNSSTLSSYTSSSEACKRYPFRALSLVEASNVINDPKCNKGPKYNNFWP